MFYNKKLKDAIKASNNNIYIQKQPNGQICLVVPNLKNNYSSDFCDEYYRFELEEEKKPFPTCKNDFEFLKALCKMLDYNENEIQTRLKKSTKIIDRIQQGTLYLKFKRNGCDFIYQGFENVAEKNQEKSSLKKVAYMAKVHDGNFEFILSYFPLLIFRDCNKVRKNIDKKIEISK